MNIIHLNIRNNLNLARQRGAAVVEFALLLILLLMIVAGVIEFGRTFWYYDALTKATRDGARFLSNAKSETSPPAIDDTLKDQAVDMVEAAATAANVPNFLTTDVEVTCDPNCDTPIYVTVSINAYPITIGGWIPIFVPTGTTTTWSATLSPYTTMRYMR
ncbi:MAG: pilus assembly protein [Methylotenera sp.]|nr:pilus assembly protein [Methylotenera sp.]